MSGNLTFMVSRCVHSCLFSGRGNPRNGLLPMVLLSKQPKHSTTVPSKKTREFVVSFCKARCPAVPPSRCSSIRHPSDLGFLFDFGKTRHIPNPQLLFKGGSLQCMALALAYDLLRQLQPGHRRRVARCSSATSPSLRGLARPKSHQGSA